MNSNVRQYLQKVVYGHFTFVMKMLGSSRVTLYNEHTMKFLEAKHLYEPPASMSTTWLSGVPLMIIMDNIFRIIKSFPKVISYGRDGLWVQHILDTLCGEVFYMVRYLISVINIVVNLWMRGIYLMIFEKFVTSIPLTKLLYHGGMQPIIVGSIWSRLVSKVAMKGSNKDVT